MTGGQPPRGPGTLAGSLLRWGLLRLANSRRAKALAMGWPATRALAARFVAGESAADAVAAVRSLAAVGCLASVDFLGENTTEPAGAEVIRDGYLAALAALSAAGLAGRAEVSIKLSALGLGLPGGAGLALSHARAICSAARAVGTVVTVDAEDHTTTEAALAIVAALRADFPATGAVLQACLRRAAGDCAALAGPGSRVRLCKGAYAEPASLAHTRPAAVAAAYLDCAETLLGGAGYPMLATHDPRLIAAVGELAARHGRPAGTYEHQLLYGVRTDEQRRLAAAGQVVRVYVPFGTDWWGYLIRRLAERPGNLWFFLRALAGR